MPPGQNQQSSGVPAAIQGVDPSVFPHGTTADQSPQAGDPNGDQPITDQQRQEMLDLINKIQEQIAHTKAIGFASQQKRDEFRMNLLNEIFQSMQEAGIDLTDRKSVADYIAQLKQDSPELADLFEKSMEVLLGGKADTSNVDPNAPLPQGENNMNNQNENQPQQPQIG